MTVDTVGGVVVVRNSGDGAWSDSTRWRLEEVVRIGALEGAADDPRVFGRVVGVAVADDGTTYVADGLASEIRVFDAAGEFVGRFGREGEGPGEFRRLDGIALAPAGDLATLDAGRSILQFFDAEGNWLRQYPLERPYTIIRGGATLAFDTAGRFYDGFDISSAPVQGDTLAYLIYRSDGVLQDTVRLYGHRPQVVMATNSAGLPIMTMPIPFTARPSSAVGPHGRMFWTTGESYRIEVVGPDGEPSRRIERAVQPVAISAGARESALEVLRRRFLEASDRQHAQDPELPEHRPAILRLEVDGEGNLWVMRNADETGLEWDILDADGRYLGAIETPGVRVFQLRNGVLAGVEYGEFGEAYVTVRRIVR